MLLAALFFSVVVMILRQDTAFSNASGPNPLKRFVVSTGGDLNNGVVFLTSLDIRIDERELVFGALKMTKGPQLAPLKSAKVRISEVNARGNAKILGEWEVFEKVKVEDQDLLRFKLPEEIPSDSGNILFLITP